MDISWDTVMQAYVFSYAGESILLGAENLDDAEFEAECIIRDF